MSEEEEVEGAAAASVACAGAPEERGAPPAAAEQPRQGAAAPHGQQPHRVLVVLRELVEARQHVGPRGVRPALRGEGRQRGGGGAPDHRRVVGRERGKQPAQARLLREGRAGVGRGEQRRGRDPGREPVASREAAQERREHCDWESASVESGAASAATALIAATAASRTTVSSTAARVSSGGRSDAAWRGPPTRGTKLASSSAMARRTSSSSSCFFFFRFGEKEEEVEVEVEVCRGRERKKTRSSSLSRKKLAKIADHLRVREERHELRARPLLAQRQRNGGQAAHGVEAQGDVLVLELVAV